jgi:hypothetical protein
VFFGNWEGVWRRSAQLPSKLCSPGREVWIVQCKMAGKESCRLLTNDVWPRPSSTRVVKWSPGNGSLMSPPAHYTARLAWSNNGVCAHL